MFWGTTNSIIRPLLFGLIIGCLSFPSLSQAEDVQKAVRAYKKGHSFLSRQAYKEANAQFLIALQELPYLARYQKTRAALRRLNGICLYHLKQYKQAARILKAYLNSPYKQKKKLAETQKIINKIEIILQRDRHTTAPPPRRIIIDPPSHHPPRREVVPRWRPSPPNTAKTTHPLAWVITGVGVLTLSAAAVTGVLAQKNMKQAETLYDEMKSKPNRNASSISLEARSALSKSKIANILYVGGGVVTASGAALLFLWKKKVPHKNSP